MFSLQQVGEIANNPFVSWDSKAHVFVILYGAKFTTFFLPMVD